MLHILSIVLYIVAVSHLLGEGVVLCSHKLHIPHPSRVGKLTLGRTAKRQGLKAIPRASTHHHICLRAIPIHLLHYGGPSNMQVGGWGGAMLCTLHIRGHVHVTIIPISVRGSGQ